MSGSHILKFTTDLSKTTKMQLLKNPLHEGEKNAHTFRVMAVRNGVAVDLTGLTVTAYYNFGDNTLPLKDCHIVDGEAEVTLSEACYIPCVFDLLVMVGKGETRSCILWVHGVVRDSMNDTVYDPESVVPNLPELIALIETIKTYDDVKLDANLGAAHAGDILYVSGDGSVQPLTLGALAAALESFHGSGSSGDNVTVPSYWLKQLEARAKYIRAAMINAGWNKSAFLFYSDAHWTYNNKQSPALLKWLYKHTPINKVAFGGDIIDNEGEVASSLDYLWEWRSALRGLEHHSVPGNHDDGNDPDNRWTDADVYTFLLAPEETPYVMRGGALYYYIDEPAEKTRYLYLDTATKDGMIINDPGQQKWLKDTLRSTPDGWHIVAIAHIWAVPDYSVTPPTAGTLGSNAVYLLEQFDKYNARTGDYASCGGRVEFCIGGHNHQDSDYTSENGIPVILVQTDSKHVRDGGVSTAGTTQENSVNAIVADYTNGIISVVRVGRGNGRIVSLDGSGSVEIPDDDTGTDTPVVPDDPIDNSWMDTSITRLIQTSNDTVGIEWKDNVTGVTYVIYDNGKEVARKSDDTQAVIFNVSAGEHSYTVRPQKSSSEIGNHSEEKTIITIADVGFTNVLRISTDTDGVTLYNGGYGYKNDVRIKSDNTEVAASGWDVTGYVPVSPGAVIRMRNVLFTRDPDELGTETSRAAIFLFDSSRKPIVGTDGNNACIYFYRGTTTSGALAAVTDEDGDYIQFTIPASWYSSVGYIRIAADDITCTSIITVNEEIPDIAPQMFCTSDGSTFIASDNAVFYVKGGS